MWMSPDAMKSSCFDFVVFLCSPHTHKTGLTFTYDNDNTILRQTQTFRCRVAYKKAGGVRESDAQQRVLAFCVSPIWSFLPWPKRQQKFSRPFHSPSVSWVLQEGLLIAIGRVKKGVHRNPLLISTERFSFSRLNLKRSSTRINQSIYGVGSEVVVMMAKRE